MDLTVKLIKPVNIAGQEITELTLNELTVREKIAHEKSHGNKTVIEQDLYYFALSCKVSPYTIESLCERDWNRLKARYWETLGNLEPEPETSGS